MKSRKRKDETEAWPFVKWIESRQRWQVDARTKGGGERRFFADKEDAMDFRNLQLATRDSANALARLNFDDSRLVEFNLTIADAVRYTIQLADGLKGSGVSVEAAVKSTIEHYKRISSSVLVGAAIDALVTAKKAAKFSKDYCQALGTRCRKLLPEFGERMLASISTEELDSFLGTFENAGGRNTVRRDLCTLFAYGETRKWSKAKTATDTAIAKETREKIEILTVEEAALIMAKATPETTAAIAIALFCGLRQSEIAKLDWRDVLLSERQLNVQAKIAKTGARRSVEIPENAVEWLQPYAKTSGPVASANIRKLLDRVRVAAGFRPSFIDRADDELRRLLAEKRKEGVTLKPWPQNAFRHSAISYKLASSKNLAAVALESGNSPAVIQQHYANLVVRSEAALYFDIRPAKQEKSAFTVEQMRQILSLDESSTDEEVVTAWPAGKSA